MNSKQMAEAADTQRELAEAGRALDYANTRRAELEATVKELRAAATEDRKRIEELERKLDMWVPTWRTPSDDGHDLEDSAIHMQRQEIKQLRKRVMELEEEHQHQCTECKWHGFHKRGCTRSVEPYVDDDPKSPF